jgi:hypothetical protein
VLSDDRPRAESAIDCPVHVNARGINLKFRTQRIEQREDEAQIAVIPTTFIAPRRDNEARMLPLRLGGNQSAKSISETGRVRFEQIFESDAVVRRRAARARVGT